jgi:hypothetical protein
MKTTSAFGILILACFTSAVGLAEPVAFDYQPDATAVVSGKTESAGLNGLITCDTTPLAISGLDPFTNAPRSIRVKNYVSNIGAALGAESLRTVLILPPTGGVNKIDIAYATALCFLNFRVVLIEGWDYDDVKSLDPDMHDQSARRALTAVRHVIETLHISRPHQLGILGTSVGAIEAALVLGVDPRVSAGALIVGGGNMVDILATSDQAQLAQLRSARMAASGIKTIDGYREALRPHIKIDPIDYAPGATGKKIWQLIATKDLTVPTADQLALQKAFGSQPATIFDGDHFHAIIGAYMKHQKDIYDFFTQNLE